MYLLFGDPDDDWVHCPVSTSLLSLSLLVHLESLLTGRRMLCRRTTMSQVFMGDLWRPVALVDVRRVHVTVCSSYYTQHQSPLSSMAAPAGR